MFWQIAKGWVYIRMKVSKPRWPQTQGECPSTCRLIFPVTQRKTEGRSWNRKPLQFVNHTQWSRPAGGHGNCCGKSTKPYLILFLHETKGLRSCGRAAKGDTDIGENITMKRKGKLLSKFRRESGTILSPDTQRFPMFGEGVGSLKRTSTLRPNVCIRLSYKG